MSDESALWTRLDKLRRFIWGSFIRVPWLCGYNTVGAVLLVVLFAVNDQGLDLLRISAQHEVMDRDSPWNLLFLVGTAVLSLCLWYSARLLLGRDFPTHRLDPDASAFGRKWLPRILGSVVPIAIAVGFYRAEGAATPLAKLFLAMGLVLLAFYIVRRLVLPNPKLMLETLLPKLRLGDLLLMGTLTLLTFVLLVAFMVLPVWLPQYVGAPAIAVTGAAGITLFGSLVLTYWPLARGAPAATTLALVFALVCGLFNDNHNVRLAKDAVALSRVSPAEHYADWRASHPVPESSTGREPLVLVAASGGGIRAAYWTATALAAMGSTPGFSDNLFAISGVSGGSVGAATYVALKREQLDSGQPGDLMKTVRTVLGKDFLSPVAAGLLFPDLAQRFFPVPVGWADRQRFLEKSWEDALGPTPNPFTRAFTDLYANAGRDQLPSLLLNTTAVGSGSRAIVSNMVVGDFSDTVDLLSDGYTIQKVRLSASAGMSARFTYVSPAGSLRRSNGTTMRVVDGGYFENSGAVTAMDLLTALDAGRPNLFPILVLIRNDPQARPVCHRAGAAVPTKLGPGPEGAAVDELLSEVAAPLRALLNARSARGRLAEIAAAKRVENQGGVVVEISLAAVTRASLAAAPSAKAKARVRSRTIEPPLGWSLSEVVRRDMDRVLDSRGGGLDREFGVLRAALTDSLNPDDKCNAR
ncbi:MAG: hypothetical protein WCA32_06275 [Chromatiaceae bacterium]